MEKPLGNKRKNMGQFGTGVVNAVSEDDGAVRAGRDSVSMWRKVKSVYSPV